MTWLHSSVAYALLVAAGLVAIASSVGVLVMKDALQRLHFVAPVGTLSAALVALAVVVDEPSPAAWIKTAFLVVVLALANGVLSHVTARAAFIRAHAAWPPPAEMRIEPRAGSPEGDG